MAQVFRADKPPSIALCEKVVILGVTVESLKRTSHLELLIRNQSECQPEHILSFPKDEEEDDLELNYSQLRSLVFPGDKILFSDNPQPPTYEVHSLPNEASAIRVHTIKVWEGISPVIAYNSSPIVTPGPSRVPSLKVGDLKRRASAMREAGSFVPVALCVLTRAKYLDSFRSLMENFIGYLKDLCKDPNCGNIVANTEFLRILSFLLNDAYIPPKCTRLKVQLGSRAVDFPVDYIGEPLHSEDCVLLLLDLIEMEALVTLWHALLMEKNVVIAGKCNNIIFAVLEGLKMILFPLRWPHAYIPLLDDDLMSLTSENMTVLAGVNTSVRPFAQIAKKPMEGVVYDIDSGKLYIHPRPMKTICQAELTRLKSTLLSLKAFRHYFYEEANVKYEFSVAMEESPGAWKWRCMMATSQRERDDWLILEVREAFLRPMLDNLGNYSACFVPGRKKNIPDFDVTEFTKRVTDCGQESCRAIDFWTELVHTRSFRDLIEEHSTWDESNVKTFGTLVDIDRSTKCANLMWHLRQSRGRTPAHSIVMKPELVPKGVYVQLLKTLELKVFRQEDNKFNTYLNRGREYIRDLMASMNSHPYFSENFFEYVSAVHCFPSEDEPRIWYGENGLLKHLALIFECYTNADFKDLNYNEMFLQRLENETSSNWQVLILKAYAQESLQIDPQFIIRSYKEAFERNGGWVPFHRFTLLLEAVTGPESQAMFQELEKCSGLLSKISRNVWTKMQDNIYEIRAKSARSSAELPADFSIHSPSLQKLGMEMGRLGKGIIRKMKRIGTVMGVVRESGGSVEIRTVPLNDRISARGQARDGSVILESLLATLKRILSKYRTKIDNGKISKLIRLLETDLEFKQLNDLIGELQTTRLVPTAQQNLPQTVSFYLNLHNFMVVYAILFKKHTPNNVFEWSKFLNLTCFIVSGERATPNLVQTLLRAPFNQTISELAALGEVDSLAEHPLMRYQLAEALPLAHFGLYMPAGFCAGLRIYTPKALEKQLEEQARIYCHAVKFDEARKVVTLPALFDIKDFGSDEDMLKVVKKAMKGEEERKGLKRMLAAGGVKVEKLKSAEDWKFSIRKVLHDEASRKQEKTQES